MNVFKEIDVGYHQILSVAYDLENNSRKNSSQANNVTRYVVDMKNSLKTSVEILKNFLEEQRKTSEILAKLKMEVETTRESNNKVIHEVETHLSEINKGIERVIHENLKYTNMLSNGFKEFKETFSDIFHLLERINSVSEKINLLSLNASVESAKLESFLKGKYRMGFHVILLK